MIKRKPCFYCGDVVEWEDNKIIDAKSVAFDSHYMTNCDEMKEIYPTLVWRIQREMERYIKEFATSNVA